MNFFTKFLSRFSRKFYFNIRNSEYLPYGSLRDNEIVGGIANAVAVNVAKMTPQVIRKDAKGMTIKNDPLSRLLNLRPCPECSTYDWLYRIGSDLVYNSNHFSAIFYNSDFTKIERIQPITVRGHRIFEDEDSGELFFRFIWDYDGKEYTVPYRFVIHIKARYNRKRFLGTPPDCELQNSVELLGITYEGIKRTIKNSPYLRGYIKYNDLADDEEIKEQVNKFKDAYMSAENEGGIAGLDESFEFVELNQKPRPLPTTQVTFFRENIYRYYGVSEKILSGDYTESEWNSFYESVIEPIAIQLSLELTYKLFSEREKGCGNKVVFIADRLQYATLQTRANIGKELCDRGAITLNKYLELLYLPPFEGGDIRVISLNYVKTEDQTLYQTGKENVNSSNPQTDDSTKQTSDYIKELLKKGVKN